MNFKKPTIRWGVAGCGQIAVDKSIPGLLAVDGARLVAVADPLPTRRDLAIRLATSAGQTGVRAYGDAAQLFADPEIDAVYIALPTGDHAHAVIAAARAKKAILCEKPLGRNAGEVREMVRAARAHSVPLMTAYMSRFSDVFQKAVQLVRSGTLGKVTFVSALFSYPCFQCYPPGAPGGWRYTDPVGGGPLLDIGVYLAFGLREILGERVATVSAHNSCTYAPAGSAIFDTTAAWFVTDRGTPGTFVTSFSHTGLHLNFYGTKGTLLVSDCFLQTPGGRLECVCDDTRLVLDTRADPALTHFDNYRREFAHFTAALRDRTLHQPSEDDSLADALLLDALKQDGPSQPVPNPRQFLLG